MQDNLLLIKTLSATLHTPHQLAQDAEFIAI
jgi:hypothetical protein